MKKYFIIGFVGIIILSLGVVGYGAYINYRDEHAISRSMDNRKLALKGEKALMYSMCPVMEIDTLTLNSTQMADAVTRVEGTLVESLVQSNSKVKKGDVLFKLVNEEVPLKIMQAESNLLKAKSRQRNAANKYQNYKELFAADATSREKLDEAEATYHATNAEVDEMSAAKEQWLLAQKRQSIISPMDGEVLLVYRNLGAFVQPGVAIALIGNFEKLYFESELEDKIVSKMVLGKDLQVVFSSNSFEKIYRTNYESGNHGMDQVFNLRVAEISPSMSEPAKIRRVLWELDNEGSLLEPKAYSSARVESKQAKNVLAIPLSAMVDESRSTVFVVNSDGVLERRAIESGVNDGKYIEILSGLKEDETVVTSGTEGLEDGMKVAVELERGDDNGHK